MSEAFSISMPHWPPPRWNAAAGDGVARMEQLLEAVGNPQHALPPVVHVAGTNGKGSTIALMRSMLQAAGYRVHAYTSPHLQQFEERIVLDEKPISSKDLHMLLEECRLAAGAETPQFFEGTTAAALLAFSRIPADILLVETGMGGRFDPTNMIEQKLLAIITPISADHTEYLGKTLAEIAWHKAGIMRAGVPCIVAQQTPEVLAVLMEQAEEIGAPLYIEDQHWGVEVQADGALYFEDAHGGALLPAPALVGAHQYHNAGLAIAAMSALHDYEVVQPHVEQGLQQAQWPGRLAPVVLATLPKEVQLWYDGGHNLGGAQAIADYVQAHWQEAPISLIFGTTQGKALDEIFATLLPLMDKVVMVPVAAEPKSYAPQTLQTQAQGLGYNVEIAASVEGAIAQILAQHHGEKRRILVFGSLYFYAELAYLSRTASSLY